MENLISGHPSPSPKRSNPDFSLEPYFQAINTEFQALGISVDIKAKKKTNITAIESAFLKGDTHIHELQIQGVYQQNWNLNRPIKIKFEVDTQPPLGFITEENLLLQPFSFYVKCYGMGDLFAGKLHTLLYRSWKNRVKGRDWYDLEQAKTDMLPFLKEVDSLKLWPQDYFHDLTEKLK